MKLITITVESDSITVNDSIAFWPDTGSAALNDALVGDYIIPRLARRNPPRLYKACGNARRKYYPPRAKEADIVGWPQDVIFVSPSNATAEQCLAILQVAEDCWPEQELRVVHSYGGGQLPEYVQITGSVRRLSWRDQRFRNYCVLFTPETPCLQFQFYGWEWRNQTAILKWDCRKRKITGRFGQ